MRPTFNPVNDLMRKLPPVFLLLLAGTGCAKHQDDLAPDPGRNVVTRYHGNVAVDVLSSVELSRHVVARPVDSVWVVLPAVYEQLEVEPTLLDSGNYRIGNTRFVTRRIEGNRLSRYLRCGSSVGNSSLADSYRVTMSVLTRVRRDQDGQTLLQSEVTGSAVPRTVSGNAVVCTSTGRLEQRIAELAAEILGR